MDQFYVTVSRQFGSQGRDIAMKLANRLHVAFYDREIVEEAARQLNLSLFEASDEEEQDREAFFHMRYPLGQNTLELRERLYEVESQIVKNLAKKGSCVIVGRCSDYILRNEKNRINFFLYAPYEARLNNCIEELNMKRADAVRMIRAVDRARNTYHKRHTRFELHDMACNHVMIDSSLLGVDDTADIMAEIAKKRFGLV